MTNGVARRTIVYIDGFNLFYGALKGRGPGVKWLDPVELCRRLLPENDVVLIRYFTAHVSARPHDPGLPVRQQAYLRALTSRPEVSVHLGEFKVTYPRMAVHDPTSAERSLRMVRVVKTEEKGSDVNIGAYMVLDACRASDDAVAVLVTNDSDLREPVRLVREELGKTVGVVNPHPARRRSRSLDATFFRQLRPNVLTQCQFPDVLLDSDGRPVHKPVGW